jgi:hypothetical protein
VDDALLRQPGERRRDVRVAPAAEDEVAAADRRAVTEPGQPAALRMPPASRSGSIPTQRRPNSTRVCDSEAATQRR